MGDLNIAGDNLPPKAEKLNLESADIAERLFVELSGPLMEDARAAFKTAHEEPSDYNKRVAFMVGFSAIEGLVFVLKTNVLAASEDHVARNYTPAELALLREEEYQVDNRGKAISKTRFIRVADNLLFTWKMYFRGILPEFSPDLSGEGWRCFRSSLARRNRITHPKSGSDLLPSMDELRSLEIGFDWVFQTTSRNMAGAVLRMRALRENDRKS